MHARPLLSCALLVPMLSTGCYERPEVMDEDDGAGTSTGSDATDSNADITGMTTAPDSTSNGSASGEPTTDGSPTSDMTGTEGSTESDDGPPPFCGDGQVDEGEECDDGENNGPGQACLGDCQLNVCGDGDQGPGEACDDGPENKLELGACAPDCSTIIEAKEIRLSATVENGNLGANPVATVDGLCEPGYKALFAHAGVREFEPLTDWPLQPYTAYHNTTDEIVWVTDATPALGVREGEQQALEHQISSANRPRIITGLHPDWATRNTKTCNGWSSASSELVAARGDQRSESDFLYAPSDDRPCDDLTAAFSTLSGRHTRVYCVEQ